MNANPGAPALDHLLSRYLEAQLAGDRRTAARVVIDEGLGAGHSVHALHAGVLQAAQREIGRLWQQNRISIAEEHMIVTAGLTEGDQVIIDNLVKVRPGAPVAPHAPGQAPAGAPQPAPQGQGAAPPKAGK